MALRGPVFSAFCAFCAFLILTLAPALISPARADETPPSPSSTSSPPVLVCPAAFPDTPPKTPAARQQEAERLAALNETCQKRPDYFAYYGVLLLDQSRPQEAAIALEKALLLAPELGGAQLDYARALAELGEIAPARHLASEIAARPDLPPGLQPWLIDQLGQWRGEGWHTHWSIELLLGTETNLNSAPGIRTLTLTLPGGNVPLELDNAEGSLSGKAWRSHLTYRAQRKIDESLLQIGTEYLLRNSPDHPATRQDHATAQLTWLQPTRIGQWGLRLEHTHSAIGKQTAYQGSGHSLLYLLPSRLTPGPCALQLAHLTEARKFPGTEHQNGRYQGQLIQYHCQSDPWQISLGLQQGRDHPRNPLRLGGDQQRTDSNLHLARRIGTDRLSLNLATSRALDDQIYSPLLGGQTRHIERQTTRLTWEHPLSPRWTLVSQIEQTHQNSNIELFGLHNTAAYIGLRVEGP